MASSNLTTSPFDLWTLQGRSVRVETAAVIVAKKLWYRADQASARDLFDLSLVIEREPEALAAAAPFLLRHHEAFLEQIANRAIVLRAQFEAIDTLSYQPTYAEAAERARLFLGQIPLTKR